MTNRKAILKNVRGTLFVKCLISSSFTKQYIGNAQMTKENDFRLLLRRGVLDCIYQHIREGGKSSPRYIILDYHIKYLGENKTITIKRINVKGKYRTYVFDKGTGKILTHQKWSIKNKFNGVDI